MDQFSGYLLYGDIKFLYVPMFQNNEKLKLHKFRWSKETRKCSKTYNIWHHRIQSDPLKLHILMYTKSDTDMPVIKTWVRKRK